MGEHETSLETSDIFFAWQSRPTPVSFPLFVFCSFLSPRRSSREGCVGAHTAAVGSGDFSAAEGGSQLPTRQEALWKPVRSGY